MSEKKTSQHVKHNILKNFQGLINYPYFNSKNSVNIFENNNKSKLEYKIIKR